MTAKPEALEPWAGGKAGRECDMALDEGAMGGACGHNMVPQDDLTECVHVLEAPLPQGDTAEHTPEVLPPCTPTEGMAGRSHDMPL